MDFLCYQIRTVTLVRIIYSEGDSDTTWCWSQSQIQLVLGMLLPFRSKMKCWGAVSHQSVRVSNTRYVTNEKCRGNIDEDRISGLPDDIILTFLSSMELKEAAKTSIFSKRWRCLWAKRTHLDFDYFLAFPESHSDLHMRSFSITQKDKYINWVNQVLGLHCNECIDTLRVCFLFDSSDTHQFDKLVRFALFRKVKNVELYSPFVDVYTLGFDILNPSVGIGDSGITSLTSIHLDRVGVTGDFIEFLLSKCYNLERLYVGFSSLLVRLKVIGLSCKLKQLAICSCFKLEELEIDAVNLMYLEYVGENLKTNLVFKSMPMLVEVAFGGTCFISWDSIFPQISHLAAHICKLSLDMKFYSFPAGPLPTFCNLKHLHMVVECSQAVSDYIPLIEACPVLHELKLEIFWSIFSVEQESSLLKIMLQHTGSDFGVYLDRINLRQTEGKTHPNLKVLKIVAYSGCHWDVKIILYIVRFACNLETIICDPNHSTVRFSQGYTIERSRARAYKLGKIIPPKISVVII